MDLIVQVRSNLHIFLMRKSQIVHFSVEIQFTPNSKSFLDIFSITLNQNFNIKLHNKSKRYPSFIVFSLLLLCSNI